MNLKEINKSWYFLLVVILIYLALAFINLSLFNSSLKFFLNLLKKIVPIFILIFVLMFLTNLFVKPETIIKHFKGKGIKKWLYAITGGIISSGPIYMWYPLLADLKEKGLSYGLISCFLYNRAIKIHLLPLFLLYFNWKYILILTFVMIFFSIIQGIIINELMVEKDIKNDRLCMQKI